MKKIIAVILVLTMCFALVACSSSTASTETKAITSPEDFAGHKISVQAATTASDNIYEMKDNGTDVEIMAYEKITQCFDDLALDRVDAVYVDSVVAAYYLTAEDSQYQITWTSDEGEPMGICLSKDNTALGNAIELAVDTLYANGKISEIATKHFGSAVTDGIRNVSSAPEIDLSSFTTITEGKLSVGVEVGYPPMEYTDDSGLEYLGFDIDMAKELAAILGLEAEFVNTSWDGIFEGLGKNQYDCVISAVSILPERQEKYFLTEPYISNQLVIVTKK